MKLNAWRNRCFWRLQHSRLLGTKKNWKSLRNQTPNFHFHEIDPEKRHLFLTEAWATPERFSDGMASDILTPFFSCLSIGVSPGACAEVLGTLKQGFLCPKHNHMEWKTYQFLGRLILWRDLCALWHLVFPIAGSGKRFVSRNKWMKLLLSRFPICLCSGIDRRSKRDGR